MVDFLDGVPVRARQLGDMGNRQEFGERFDPDVQSLRDSRSAAKRGDVFDYPRPAVMTVHTTDRDILPDATFKPVPLSD